VLQKYHTKKFMIYTSHKLQAKRITSRTWRSSTDITNIQKELLGDLVSLLSHYFFYYKKQQACSQQLAVSLFFFYSKKQQATGSSAASSQLKA